MSQKLFDSCRQNAKLHSESPRGTAVAPGTVQPKSTFVSDVLKLVSGSASAQILAIVTAPFIARLFAPEAFGTAALFVSITGVISAFVGLRYELSIVLPEKDEDAANAMAVSVCCVLAVSSLTGLGVLFGGDWMLRLLKAPQLHSYLWLVPVNVLLNGFGYALLYWNTRKKNFGRQTVSQLAGAVFFAVAQLSAGLAGRNSGGTIILATILSVAVSTSLLGLQTALDSGRLIVHSITPARMIATLKRYSSFPKYSTASAVLNNFGWQMPTFMLSAYFSASVVGHFSLGNRVLRIPVNLVGANIATVFFQHASESHQAGGLRESVDKIFKYLIAVFVFPSLMLCLIGRDLFVLAFGNRWAEAGIYSEILSLYVLLWFMAVPLGLALNVLEKQALELRLVVIVLLTRGAALFIGGSLGSARLALVLFSVVGVLAYGYYCAVVLRSCAIPISHIGHELLSSLKSFAPAGLIILLLKLLGISPVAVLLVSAAFMTWYYAHMIRNDVAGKMLLTGLLQKFAPARSTAAS